MKRWLKRWSLRLLAGGLILAAWPAPTPAAPALPALTVAPSASGILALDRSGDGRIVEAVGDLRDADRVAVIVPGVATTLDNFHNGLGGVVQRSPYWQASQLYAAAGADARKVAVVAWLGYDPPDGVDLAAVRSSRAVAGASALVRFVSELTAYRPGISITLIGHSYGSLVLAYAAARLPAQVTDLVVLGSPGMDVGRAGQLHAHARLWAGSAAGDWTRWLPDLRILGLGHGTNPSRPWFGTRRLDVAGAHGHDGYFVPGTTSLRSLAAVVDGGAS
jgi:pimeloyl-ACP methyl ester carboxylesterase